MAIKTRDEILNVLKTRVGDDADDDTLSFIEDISDTLNDYETRVSDSTNWKQKYEDNDAEWRAKYRDRFFSGGSENDAGHSEDEADEEYKPMKFEDLFTTKE